MARTKKITLAGEIDGKAFDIKDDEVITNETGIDNTELLKKLKADAAASSKKAKDDSETPDEPELAEDFDKSVYQVIQVPMDANNPNSAMTSKNIVDPKIVATFMNTKGQVNRNALHAYKCKLRAASVFNVTIEHLQEAYTILNGKKIDDVYVIDILDRYGFMNGGKCMNRVDLAAKYNRSLFSVDICERKIKEIVKHVNIKAAYARYVADLKNELDKAFKDDILEGSTR